MQMRPKQKALACDLENLTFRRICIWQDPEEAHAAAAEAEASAAAEVAASAEAVFTVEDSTADPRIIITITTAGAGAFTAHTDIIITVEAAAVLAACSA